MIPEGPLRSWLFTPGNRPGRFANAGKAGADVSILDLEDAVPRDDKGTARSAVLEFLSSPPPDRPRSALRVNGSATPRLAGLMFGAADMAADLGTVTAWAPLAHARSSIVLACTLAGVMPIDSPFFDLRDSDGLASEATDAAAFISTQRRRSIPTRSAGSTTSLPHHERTSSMRVRSSLRTRRVSGLSITE